MKQHQAQSAMVLSHEPAGTNKKAGARTERLSRANTTER